MESSNGRRLDSGTLLRWARVAGRLMADGLIAVGCHASGACPPDRSAAYQQHLAERAIWAQLPEVHLLLPLLSRGAGPDGGRDQAGGRR